LIPNTPTKLSMSETKKFEIDDDDSPVLKLDIM
jgi:hypothetical protein